jgi:hypothetical protein
MVDELKDFKDFSLALGMLSPTSHYQCNKFCPNQPKTTKICQNLPKDKILKYHQKSRF